VVRRVTVRQAAIPLITVPHVAARVVGVRRVTSRPVSGQLAIVLW
jgi:hypothetical protein